MYKRILAAVLGTVVALPMAAPVFAEQKPEIKNIIYMIPDGGGMVPFQLSDELKQAGGWDRAVFPNSTVTEQGEMYIKKYLVGAVTTNSANADITDSAAAGTALSSGYKTNNSYVGVDPQKIPHANLLEAAQYKGKKTGMVSTYEWTNATPASFSAHDPERGNYTSMSEQIVNQGIDVVLGGGFGAAKWGDISEAEKRGYDIIDTKEELAAVEPGDKIWGNLVSGAFPFDIEKGENIPDLAQMTEAAITALDDGDEDGFFLMVEGSRVDGGGHSNDARGMVSEFLAFDEACKVALEYAENRKDTLVVIVPDHDTGGMILPEDTKATIEELKAGKMTTEVTWESADHTARNGGLFIYAPQGVEYPEGISGKDIGTDKAFEENVIDNTAIAPYLAKFMDADFEEISKNLFVDVTDMGTYDSELEIFRFNNYNVNVKRNASYAYVGKDIADLEGQVTAYINGRFYVPALLMDIAEGKAEYDTIDYVYPVSSLMTVYMPDTSNINKWNGRIKVANFVPNEEISGKIVFTYPESFKALGEIEIAAEGENTCVLEFECPEFDVKDMGLEFCYDVIGKDGEKCSFKSKFSGLAFAGYADSAITIDGVIDEEVWTGGVVMKCNDASRIVMIEDWKGERDLSAEFSMLWDKEYFYMYAVVTDEVFVTDPEVAKLWQGDSVQFGIYHDTAGAMIAGTAGKKFEEIGIAYMENEPKIYRYVSQNGLTEIGEIALGDGVQLACTREGDDTVYELKMKWSDLLGYEYVPEVGGVLGFSALINDNDGGGRRGWMEYGSGIGKSKNVNQFVMMPLLDFTNADKEIEIYVNDEKVESDVAPFIREDTVLVPVRAIFEAIGAEVEWVEETGTVISRLDGNIVTMQIGDTKIFVNDQAKETGVEICIENERTMVPVRAITESYGYNVSWDEATSTVSVTK